MLVHRERARLAHQPIDQVPIIDVMLVASTQPRQTLHQLLRVPHFQVFHVHTHFHVLADQPARHGVAIALHMNLTARVHLRAHTLARFQTPRRQRLHLGQLLRQTLVPIGIELLQKLPQKFLVLLAARKVAAATQHQRLIDCFLETPMPLFHIAVLIAMPRLDLLARHLVVIHQPLVTLRELLLVRSIVYRQAHPIGAMPLGRRTQLPQRVLQTFAQALEALREADRRRLPVRVGQHEVIDQVIETQPLDRHLQLVHRGEVRGAQPARLVHLREEHLLRRPGLRAPALDVPLQRPQLAVSETARITPLQLGKNRLGLQARVAIEQCANLVPDRLERIGPRCPSVRLGDFAGQLAQIAVLACRLLIHVGEPRRPSDRAVVQEKPEQILDLLVGDHRKPPCAKSLRSVYADSCNGKSNCRRTG
jgi:hypothetical protein